MREIERHKTTLIFCNTRSLAELIFQDLWAVNEQHLPIGIHHGSLALEARRKVENAVADGRLRALVCTASLDLGVDWGDVDLVIQMGAPKGSSRLHAADRPRQPPARRAVARRSSSPATASNISRRAPRSTRSRRARSTPEIFRPGALDVLAQHIMARRLRRAVPRGGDARRGALGRALCRAQRRRLFRPILSFIESGGYSLRAYDRFRRIARDPDGLWRVSHPRFIQQHRMNAGIIVDAPLYYVRFRNGRQLGTVEDNFAATLSPGDTFFFSGLVLEVERIDGIDLIVHATSQVGADPDLYGRPDGDQHQPRRPGARLPPRPRASGRASPTPCATG